jgi:hypothetical protein
MTQQAYVAQLIYRIRCAGIQEEQYEEQWRLIFATDERAALAAAHTIGSSDEAVFADRQGRIIEWQLIAVKDLQPVSLTHGSLLASVVKEVTPVAAPVWAVTESY